MEALTGVTIVCWLMGTRRRRERVADAARRPPADAVGEARRHAGARRRLRGGRAARRPRCSPAAARSRAAAHATWRIPLEVLEADPADHERWRAAPALPSAPCSAVEGDRRLIGTPPMDPRKSSSRSSVGDRRRRQRRLPRAASSTWRRRASCAPRSSAQAARGAVTLDLAGLRFLDTSGPAADPRDRGGLARATASRSPCCRAARRSSGCSRSPASRSSCRSQRPGA